MLSDEKGEPMTGEAVVIRIDRALPCGAADCGKLATVVRAVPDLEAGYWLILRDRADKRAAEPCAEGGALAHLQEQVEQAVARLRTLRECYEPGHRKSSQRARQAGVAAWRGKGCWQCLAGRRRPAGVGDGVFAAALTPAPAPVAAWFLHPTTTSILSKVATSQKYKLTHRALYATMFLTINFM
jgi:hypothetical protein